MPMLTTHCESSNENFRSEYLLEYIFETSIFILSNIGIFRNIPKKEALDVIRSY